MSWEEKPLSDCSEFVSRGRTPKYGTSKYTKAVKSAQVYSDKIKWEKCPSLSEEFELKCPKKYHLRNGDVLLNGTGTGTLGRPGIVEKMPDGIFVPDSHINLIRTSNNLHPKYLFYWLQSPYGQGVIQRSYTGSTNQIELSALRVSKFKIPLPPLPVQKRIAAILDVADAYRQKTKALIEKYDQLTQSLFLEMFGDPVRNDKGWEKSIVIDYCKCIVPGRDKPKSFTGSIPWVTTNDLQHLGFTRASKSGIGLTISEISKVRAKLIPKGSVIMTCVGDLGIVSINQERMVVNQQLHTFQCGDRINNIFLMYNLSFQKPYMLNMASSTTVPYMNKTIANNTPTICPPLATQEKFARIVEMVEIQKNSIKLSVQKATELFHSLLQKAFKGAEL